MQGKYVDHYQDHLDRPLRNTFLSWAKIFLLAHHRVPLPFLSRVLSAEVLVRKRTLIWLGVARFKNVLEA